MFTGIKEGTGGTGGTTAVEASNWAPFYDSNAAFGYV